MTPEQYEVEAPSMPPQIHTSEEAISYIESCVVKVESMRAQIAATDQLALQQWRGFHAFLLRHGHALGTCDAFLRAGLIGPIAYNMLVIRIRKTLRIDTLEAPCR